MARVDHNEARRLLLDIDENGTRLTKDQIDFVAELIDSSATEFSPRQVERLERIHYRKVTNGKPEYE